MSSSAELRASLDQNGYVLIPSVLSPSQLARLREASSRATDLARSGKWPYIRTLPKQFPPWTSSAADGIWGVQHVMHPALPDSATFTESYFSDKILDTVKGLLECDDNELVMELYNLLVRPDRDFELRWHRDDIPATATAAEEMDRLAHPAWHAQWNLALYDDSSLIVVPGSHRRSRTEQERSAEPYENEMPAQLVVEMKEGDVVFYNNNILHRGVYTKDKERMTLHGSVGCVKGGPLRARNVLQHGVGEWVEDLKLEILQGEQKERAETMRQRLVQLGRDATGVGYSHDD
ncbi:MAG: hypothetical protein M4579_000250 [Chaenotheca gracillima]|nr:MAG: hypothetical protein M4579_000250 [Chaenotheca gracillima]